MPREFRHLVMTNIRRIAHSPREAQCIARVLLMQVILVCVAHAAQKTWMKGRMAGGDPGVNVMPGEIPATATREIKACEVDPAAVPVIPLRTLWECIAGTGGEPVCFPGRLCFSGRYRPASLTPGLTAGY
jgi:hypothetical protein